MKDQDPFARVIGPGACNPPTQEDITRPSHYGGEANPHEPIKVIEHYKLGFHVGNGIKYLLRAGRKPGEAYAHDLKKAIWYLQRELARVEGVEGFDERR
jgi:hypothetical protein